MAKWSFLIPTMKQSGYSAHKKRRPQGHPLAIALARLMAGVALLNLCFVVFDFSYISLRDFYLARLPLLVKGYDKVKGIEPYRDTDAYLKSLEQLNQALETKEISDPDVGQLVQKLSEQSIEMVNENPFQLANKSGTLEKIKNRMRDRLELDSSKDSFRTFWSVDYLKQQGTESEVAWFNRKIAPLINTNYFRPIGESGGFVDYFWLIDMWFAGVFALDLLVRTLIIKRRRPNLAIRDAVLWRWYDWFLLLPFWRILRIFPVVIRCHQVAWIDLGRIENQVTGYLAEHLLDDLSEMILVRTFTVAQSTVRDANLGQWLSKRQAMVEINDVNEMQEITERLMTVFVMKVLPDIQPELENVLRHAIEQSLNQLPVYKDLQFLPGINVLPNQVTKQVVHQLTDVTSQTLEATLKDEKGKDLAAKLTESAIEALQTELQDERLLSELQQLIGDMLEEWKLTLLQSFESQNVEQTATEVAQFRQSQELRASNATLQVISPSKSISSGSTKMR